jgi:glycosyltransferase involved in cell wall biosynthesis
VIPCYNYGRFLPDCLHSIFGQQGEFDDIEVIAIDDCSTDDTWKILTEWNDPRLTLMRHEKNRGHVVSVNEGLSAAKGKFVARIDPDDRYRPNFLATLLPLFEQNPRVGYAYGDAAMIDASGTTTADRCPQPHAGRPFAGWALLEIMQKNYICAPTAIARREAWHKHLPIWEGMAFNDIYFNMMIARDWHFAYAPLVVSDYRVHGSNHHSTITLNKSEEPSLFRLLDWIYSHPETDPSCERQKQAAKKTIYGAHYLELADKYFGVGHNADARRCYWQAFKRRPAWLFRPGPVRRFLATLLGRSRYEAAKHLLSGSPAT